MELLIKKLEKLKTDIFFTIDESSANQINLLLELAIKQIKSDAEKINQLEEEIILLQQGK